MRSFLFGLLFFPLFACSQTPNQIRLIIRSDDIGFCHAVNQACIQVYREGISRSVEVRAPSPWFPEAVKMLRANPGYDVGVHLCLTSEWENLRWRPLTHGSSLMDADGYFHPFVWPNKNDTARSYLKQNPIDLAEVEAELRAQIELVKKHLPWVSHLSGHMGCNHASPEVTALVEKLAKEYNLPIAMPYAHAIEGFSGAEKSPAEKEKALATALNNLQPGTYFLVEHPGYDTPEMKTIGHKGYENVGYDRAGVTQAFTSKAVLAIIKKRNIRLLSIKEWLQSP